MLLIRYLLMCSMAFLVGVIPVFSQGNSPGNRITKTIKQAESLYNVNKKLEAHALLQAHLKEKGSGTSLAEHRQMRIAIADTYIRWAHREESNYAWKNAGAYYLSAYEIDKTERKSKASADLQGAGESALNLSDTKAALDYFQEALALRKNRYKIGQAETLNYIGLVYTNLGKNAEAIKNYNQALEIYTKADNKIGQIFTLGSIGVVYFNTGKYNEAIKWHKRALYIANKTIYKGIKAGVLLNLGNDYMKINDYKNARNFYNQSLVLFQYTGDKKGEGAAISAMSFLHVSHGDWDESVRLLNQALPLQRLVGDISGEANTLRNLMWVWQAPTFSQRNLQLATMYGKKSVNLYQSMRVGIREMDQSIQAGFLTSVESVYRTLAEILIEQGRILEAQQVLNLLKQQELFDLLRRDASELSKAKLAELNRLEEEADQLMRTQGDKVIALARERASLQNKKVGSQSKEARRLRELDTLLTEARLQYQRIIDKLQALFKSDRARIQDNLFTPKDAASRITTLKRLHESTNRRSVIVYTLFGESKLRFLILSDLGIPVVREFKITASELNNKIITFRNALVDPRIDPRPLGKELYNILIKPVEADLDDSQADSVFWSLDWSLRLIPLAALSPDGEHYLIEQKRTHSIFTAALPTDMLLKEPKQAWKALALGVTKSFEKVENAGVVYRFKALAGVPHELDAIGNLLPGSVQLRDNQFTLEQLKSKLADTPGGFPVVHIASHFHFQPTGDETRSFLLTGDGKPLTLEILKGISDTLFYDTDLVTLSACETGLGAVGKRGTGAEVEGFGALAQERGAGAVIASLWPVSDAATTALMQRFYEIRQKEPNVGKVECLRRAQFTILQGEVALDSTDLGQGAGEGRGPVPGFIPPATKRFVPPKAAPAAHPFYWASFVLMGNPR